MAIKPIFRHSGVVMVRTTTAPPDLDIPSGLNVFDDAAVRRDGTGWLLKTWTRADVRDAIALASPNLAAQLDRLTSSQGEPPVKDVRRAALSLAGYMLRWQRRATPFGVFAGVTLAAEGPTSVLLGSRHSAIARADSEWLLTLISALEQNQDLLQQLTVIADNTSFMRDGRLITALRAEHGDGKAVPLRNTSVRFTRPVQAALTFAVAPYGSTTSSPRCVRRSLPLGSIKFWRFLAVSYVRVLF